MDGGPSEVYASSGAAVFCAGMNPQGHTMPDACSMLMEPHGYDEECSMLMEPQGHTNRCLMLIARNLLGGAADGSAETNAGCGDDNTFYSTLDRIDSGEVPIRAMAEIL